MTNKVPKQVSEWLSAIGKKGGSARTKAKRNAVRQNGKKGGRPRKKAAA